MIHRTRCGLVQWLLAASFAILSALGVAGLPGTAAAVSTGGWELEAVACPSGGGLSVGELIGGPGTPPSGSGSLELRIASDGKGWFQARYPLLTGIALSSLTTLRYSTFVETPHTTAAPYLTLSLDLNGDGTPDDQLVFEPAKNATVTPQEWQTWDTTDGVWWSPNGTAGLTRGHPQPISVYLTQYPNARLASVTGMPSLMLAAGCLSGYAWNNWQGAVDALTLVGGGINVLWDFEPTGILGIAPPLPSPQDSPVLVNLTPRPWSTISPGNIPITFTITSANPIARATVTLASGPTGSNPQSLSIQLSGTGTFQGQASTSVSLQPGLYTIRAVVQDTRGNIRRVTWPFVVSTNPGDSWWFFADGTPRRDAIEATLRSLVEAFRWHLYGETWDGQPHADLPTHASVNAGTIRFDTFTPDRYATVQPGAVRLAVHVTSSSALKNITLRLNGQALTTEGGGPNEFNATVFTEQPLTPSSYGLTATATDADGHQLTTTWSIVVSSDSGESAWFNADSTPKVTPMTRTLKALVEAFRWHLWGISWDGQPHPDLPTHANQVQAAQPLPSWFDNSGQLNPQAVSETLRSLVEVFRWHFWGESWDGSPHPEVPTHASGA